MKTAEKEIIKFKDLVLSEYKKGNIVISTFDGLKTAKLTEIVKQSADGLLYDLNRDEMTILTFINDPKWINDYASSQVIRLLKKENDDLRKKLDYETERRKAAEKLMREDNYAVFGNSLYDNWQYLVNKESEIYNQEEQQFF